MKRRKKTPTLFPQPEGECFLCAVLGEYKYHSILERHHIFYGSCHAQAEKYGFTINLCRHHHRGDEAGDKDAVHRPDKNDLDDFLKRWAQAEYEKTHTREEFMNIFSRSWL